MIQGDGINLGMLAEILSYIREDGWSAENVAFGMGGGLLQQVNRDTLGYAMKASAAQAGGIWRGFNKSPVDAPEKASKAGRLALVREGGWRTEPLKGNHWRNMLRPVWRDGTLLVDESFAAVCERASEPVPAPALATAAASLAD